MLQIPEFWSEARHDVVNILLVDHFRIRPSDKQYMDSKKLFKYEALTGNPDNYWEAAGIGQMAPLREFEQFLYWRSNNIIGTVRT